MQKTYNLCVIGNAITDYSAMVTDDFLSYHGITKGSMTLVDSAVIERLLGELSDIRVNAGGSAANSAVAFSSLGKGASGADGSCFFIGLGGKDESGLAFRRDLSENRIGYSDTLSASDSMSSQCLVLVTPDGERSLLTYLGASRHLKSSQIDSHVIGNSDIVLIEGYILDGVDGADILFDSSHSMVKSGTKVAFSLSDANLVAHHGATICRYLQEGLCDILLANSAEFAALLDYHKHKINYNYATSTDCTAMLSGWRSLSYSTELTVLTLGASGSLVITPDSSYDIAAPKVVTPIDTTGAGDYFAGGLLFGLIHKMAPQQAARLGSYCASHIIGYRGTRSPTGLADLVQDCQKI